MAVVRKIRTGHTVEEISPEDFHRIKPDFPMYDGLVRFYPGGWFHSKYLPDVLDKIYDFEFRPTDTIVLTYPKSGTTWMLEIVWTLFHNPDLKNPDANARSDFRSPHFELDTLLKSEKLPGLETQPLFMSHYEKVVPKDEDHTHKIFNLIKYTKGPRVIKSHLPVELFPPSALKTAKFVYLARDARDVIVSKEHFWRVVRPHSYQGTFDGFVDYFLNEEQYNHPYWPHVKAAYDLRDHPNLLFLYFEELKENPSKEIRKVSEFIGLHRSPEQIQNVVDFTNFKSMKKRDDEGITEQPMSLGGAYVNTVNNEKGTFFFRKGEVGSWKVSFTPEQVTRITEWMNRNMTMFDHQFRYNQIHN